MFIRENFQVQTMKIGYLNGLLRVCRSGNFVLYLVCLVVSVVGGVLFVLHDMACMVHSFFCFSLGYDLY